MRFQIRLWGCSSLPLALTLFGCATTIYRPSVTSIGPIDRDHAETVLRHSVAGTNQRITKVSEDGFVSSYADGSFSHQCEFKTMDDLEVVYVEDKGYGVNTGGDGVHYSWIKDKALAIRMADAIYVLKNKLYTDAADPRSQQERFVETARKYRFANPKPVLPEDARRHRLQAEEAVAGKRYGDAVRAYDSALQVAPWWPDGHFNNAIILSELKLYDDAIEAMKRYLELVPNAPDVRAAQDRIYQWEGQRLNE